MWKNTSAKYHAMDRLPIFVRALIVVAALAASANAAAQKWPEKPVRIVTPFAPGGGTDIFSRLLAQRFTEVYSQQFVVENRPGAGSTLGTEYVAKSPPDGYTLLMTSASHTFTPGLYPRLRYDPVKDFTAVAQVVRVPHVIVVLPTFPAANLQEFVKIARSRPGEVLFASSGQGSAMHLAGEFFAMVTKTKLTHVPYKGGGATVAAVLGGEATTAFNTLETVIAQIRAKRVRALAVSTRERAAAIPDVPTAAEAGVKGYEVVGWFGLLAPAATPPAVIQQLSAEVSKTMALPAMRERAMQEGATPVNLTPAEFQKFLNSEIARWTKVIQDAGIKLE
jgi:tripartite-type tricarboxylate transporter receptor subunit TctC